MYCSADSMCKQCCSVFDSIQFTYGSRAKAVLYVHLFVILTEDQTDGVQYGMGLLLFCLLRQGS